MGQVIRSSVDTNAEPFTSNRAAMAESLAEIDDLLTQVTRGGGTTDADKASRSVGRLRSRGKMLPRERIEYLLDPMSGFLELSPLAGWGTDDPLGGGIVTGIGTISGTECMVIANDPTVKGGSQGPTAVRKGLRAMDIARENRLPLVSLTESGGADLPKQADIFVPGGASFKNLTQLSAAGIPTITLVFGSSTAGGAYVPGMSDYVVLQKEAARVYLGGPPLVKMAIDEDADDEQLGGAEMHARTSGLADYLAEDEADALRIGRQIVSHLRWRKQGPGPDEAAAAPLYDPEELLGIPSADVRMPFEAREVLARVVDGSEFEEFKPLYGTTLVTGWGHIGGFPVGVLANNGILFSEESHKGAQFIQLCNRMDVPILFAQNITGFMVGSAYEAGGIAKDGAKLVNAVATASVPKFTVIIGGSFGAGNYAMCGRAYEPRMMWMWPNARISVMGGEQASLVLSTVKADGMALRGEAWNEKERANYERRIKRQYEQQGHPYYASARLWDNGVIDPVDTRKVLGQAISASLNKPRGGETHYGIFRM